MIAGRYSLEREIGRGGMGAVWLGRDEVLGRAVALKQIGLVPGTDGTDLERAEREARVSGRLHHPHVVAVFDLVIDGPAHWLVMEYVDGCTLAELVRRDGPLAPEAATPLLAQVADALVAAHDARIDHRDVKPSNILIGADGTAKLSDFGIARRTDDPTLTQTGLMIGSPTYLAPEVASGARGEAAADVWSFGATMFHVLTGAAPYPSDDNVLRTLYRIVHDDPPTAAGAGPLAPVLAGALRKDPETRWTMRQVRDALLSPRSYDETPTTVITPQAKRPARRRLPLPALVGAVVVVALMFAVAGYAVLGGGTSSPPAATSGGSDRPTPSTAPSRSPSATPSAPTATGMKDFIRRYVATVSTDPRRAWRMLTPAFQRASGGLSTYLRFWRPATDGKVLDITADPETLRVSYHVHFDHFHNGPGPTVLDLVHGADGYRIDAEHTAGFVPAH